MEITKDMTIGELLMLNEAVAPFLMMNGMGCVFCPSSAGETLEEACLVHGLDSDILTAELNDMLNEYKEAEELSV